MKAVRLPRKLKKKIKRILSKKPMYHNGKTYYPMKKLKIVEFFGDGGIVQIID